jgi:hypothetical protein
MQLALQSVDEAFPLYVEADQIYNLACPASPIHYQHDPVQTTKSAHGLRQHKLAIQGSATASFG